MFTNSSKTHAINVLARLGVKHHFEAIFDIHAAGYIPKQELETYGHLITRHHIRSDRAIMVDR